MTRAAESLARNRLSPAVLDHAYRSYAFGAALGWLSGLDVDRDLLYAAAVLHDIGLAAPVPRVDFTVVGARAARDLAEQAGLSSTATDTLLTAITLHHTPGYHTRPRLSPVPALRRRRARRRRSALLESARLPHLGDVALPGSASITTAFRLEAAHVPAGRVAFLRRYGAFDLAIKLAPFRD